jgi:hypothetical protein
VTGALPLADRWVQVGLAITWLSAGVSKLADLERTTSILRVHGMLADVSPALVALGSIVEVAAGAALLLFLRPSRARSIALGLSLLCTLSVSLYIAGVPTERLQRVGCGCGGVTSVITPVFKGRERTGALLVNGAMAAAAIWLGWRGRPHSAGRAPTD